MPALWPVPTSAERLAKKNHTNMFDFDNALYLGTDYADRPFALGSGPARRRHLYIVGQTGTGKSTLLLNLLLQDLARGRGCALLDPHGDLAEAALGFLPTARGDHLVYFNPSDLSRPIGFNLIAKVPDDLRPLVADGCGRRLPPCLA